MEIAPIALALALTLIWQRRLSVFQALSGGAYGGIIGIGEFFLSVTVVKFLNVPVTSNDIYNRRKVPIPKFLRL